MYFKVVSYPRTVLEDKFCELQRLSDQFPKDFHFGFLSKTILSIKKAIDLPGDFNIGFGKCILTNIDLAYFLLSRLKERSVSEKKLCLDLLDELLAKFTKSIPCRDVSVSVFDESCSVDNKSGSTPGRDSAFSSKTTSPLIHSEEDDYKVDSNPKVQSKPERPISSGYKDEIAFKRAQELRDRRMQYTWDMRRQIGVPRLSLKPLTQFDSNSPIKPNNISIPQGCELGRTPAKAVSLKKTKDPKQPIAGLPRVMTPPQKKVSLPTVTETIRTIDPKVKKGSLRGGKAVSVVERQTSMPKAGTPDSRRVGDLDKRAPIKLAVSTPVELLPAPITQTVKYLIPKNDADKYEYKQVLNLSGKIVKWGVFKKAVVNQKEELVYGWDDYQAKLSKKGSSMKPLQSPEFSRLNCSENFEESCRNIYRIANGHDHYECRKGKIYDFDRNKSFDANALLKECFVSVKSTLSLEEKCKALNKKENERLQKFHLDTDSIGNRC